MESLKVNITLPVSAEILYNAWLNSKEHTAFTGAPAKASNKVNGKFTAWDDYIRGKNIELIPTKKIVQTWRSIEFDEDAPDSILELTFEEKRDSTTLHLHHYHLQKGDAKKYTDGWKESYFEPMKSYFNSQKTNK
ncbi:MAG: SRPBCC domain-containing protein [Bacteroidota bacterium]|nr:SRPBCC domain-containing protein [Bacteroidota bacterium]